MYISFLGENFMAMAGSTLPAWWKQVDCSAAEPLSPNSGDIRRDPTLSSAGRVGSTNHEVKVGAGESASSSAEDD